MTRMQEQEELPEEQECHDAFHEGEDEEDDGFEIIIGIMEPILSPMINALTDIGNSGDGDTPTRSFACCPTCGGKP